MSDENLAEMLEHKLLTERKHKQQIAELQQELDAARAEIDQCWRGKISMSDNFSKTEKQLTDLKAQIADYEAAINPFIKYYMIEKSDSEVSVNLINALNKWRVK